MSSKLKVRGEVIPKYRQSAGHHWDTTPTATTQNISSGLLIFEELIIYMLKTHFKHKSDLLHLSQFIN